MELGVTKISIKATTKMWIVFYWLLFIFYIWCAKKIDVSFGQLQPKSSVVLYCVTGSSFLREYWIGCILTWHLWTAWNGVMFAVTYLKTCITGLTILVVYNDRETLRSYRVKDWKKIAFYHTWSEQLDSDTCLVWHLRMPLCMIWATWKVPDLS